jgi:CotH kinase protein/Chitobiase/beta-hexosaminidase C-terminal domain/Lamin Tail Domain/Divergent InlB B-repeat domain
MKKFYLSFFILISFTIAKSQVKISEMATINPNAVLDDANNDGSYIEIANYGSSAVSIGGYGLSDNTVWNKWIFPPNTTLPANGFLMVFADGKNYNIIAPGQALPNHWETAIYDYDQWQYFADTTEPLGAWTTASYMPNTSWQTAAGGFGYGDGDDSTITPANINTVYIRKTFTVTNKADLISAIISLDYDDGVAIYLNGVALGNKNCSLSPLTYGTYADGSHEAAIYNNAAPDTFQIDNVALQNLLVNGTNVLSAEVHNASSNSSDLSLRMFLHFGIANANNYYNTTNPSWFSAPVYTSTSNSFFHANFKLKNLKTIRLSNASGALLDAVNTNTTNFGTVLARIPDNAAALCYTRNATPFLSNNTATCALGLVEPVAVSINSGNYATTQSLALSCITPGTTIYYTTNGNAPDANSTLYTSPITISATTIIRAIALKPNFIAAPSATYTYLINENTTLPVVSIVCDSFKMYAFQNSSFFDNNPETEGSFEYFLGNKGASVYKGNCGVEQHGRGSSFFNPKPMRVNARKKYGESDFIYPFFEDKIYTTYDGLIFRNGGNDNFNTHLRDYVAHKAVEEMNMMNQATKPVVVFLNGNYYGVFYMKEVQNSNYLQNRIGFDKDSTEFVRKIWTSNLEASKGTLDSFLALENYVSNNAMANNAVYQNALQYIDKKNYIDYFATEIYIANTDWLFNNIRCGADGRPGKKRRWQYLLWDLEWGFNLNQGESNNTLEYLINYGNSFSNTFVGFMNNANFKRDFINRSADLMNTIFKENNLQATLLSKKAEINNDYQRTLSTYNLSNTDWQNNLAAFEGFIANRPNYVRSHYASLLGLAGTDTITLQVNPAGSGRILISTITPTTYPWKGVYFNGNPVNIQAIPNPGFRFNNWNANAWITNTSLDSFYGNVNANANFTANFVASTTDYSKLIVSEINYNSNVNNDFGDWVEVLNPGPKAFDASGYKVTDASGSKVYTMPKHTVLQANQRLVLSNNLKNFYRQTNQVYNYVAVPFGLSSSGDAVKILNPNTTTVYNQVAFGVSAPWPTTPNGGGYTLELINPLTAINTFTNWIDGCPLGSPGVAFIPCSPLPIRDFAWAPTLQKDGSVSITWQDAKPENVMQYTILKSNNGLEFLPFAKVAASTSQLQYTASDHQPNNGITYYKIETQFVDESTSESEIKTITKTATMASIYIIPNPTNGNIVLQGDASKKVSVTIYNTIGILQKHWQDVQIGQNLILPTAMANGNYIVCIQSNGVKSFMSLQVIK